MATITKSADAPEGVVSFSFGHTSFSLDSPTATYETEEPSVLGDAANHPWLTVADDAPAPEPAPEPVFTPTFGSGE